MKWLIILALVLLLIGIIFWRYRKHIQTAWFMYRAFRKMRSQMKPPKEKQVEPKSQSSDTQLVRCPKCQKWVPTDEAVKLKTDFYCSLVCLEESITFQKR